MKNYQLFKSIGILTVVAIAIVVVNMVGAAGYPVETPPMNTPASLLDISTTSQAKVGNLALGATSAGYSPSTTLDVNGAAVFDLLGVLGTAWFKDNFKIGSSAPVNTDTELYVQGSRIRSVALANSTGQTICADSDGRLILCAAPPPAAINGACGSANGTTPTSAPTTGLCNTGTVSAVTGTGPWLWTCTGQNGGTIATCSTGTTSPQPIPAPNLIFYGSIFTGTNGGAHDGVEWAPVQIPGTSTYATRYELQTFNPNKNFVDQNTGECPNNETPDATDFCPNAAQANTWKQFGIVDYSQATGLSQTYNNWLAGNNPVWNARIWDFFSGWGPNGWGTQTNLEGNYHDSNGCFSSTTVSGCALRVRAIVNGVNGPWSNVMVLYDPEAPTQLACSTKAANVAAHHFQLGIQNFTNDAPCATDSAQNTYPNSVRLTWQKSKRDNQTAPFLTYTTAVACNASNAHAVIGLNDTSSRLITTATINSLIAGNNGCDLENTVFPNRYIVLPNREYPAQDFVQSYIYNNNNVLYPVEYGFINFNY